MALHVSAIFVANRLRATPMRALRERQWLAVERATNQEIVGGAVVFLRERREIDEPACAP